MLVAYINYRNPKVSIHGDSACGAIQKMRKPNQRHVKVNLTTFSAELQKFLSKRYSFAANPAGNDMWVDVSGPYRMEARRVIGATTTRR